MPKTTQAPATIETDSPDAALVHFGAWIARVMSHAETPDTLREALGMVIVNVLSNNSGYDWSSDAEGLRFMLPRILFHMNEQYARGCIHTLDELIIAAVPSELCLELREAHWLKGGE